MTTADEGKRTYAVSFVAPGYPAVQLAEGASLGLHLTVRNSPVLFGCRTGICGTCRARVEVLAGQLEGPDAHERETLEILGEGHPNERLLCQLKLSADVQIEVLGGP